MKFPRSLIKTLAVLGPLLGSTAGAAVSLTFSGGNGTPLSLTISTPITYTVTQAAGSAPFFIFEDVGNFIPSMTVLGGTITYSINGGPPLVVATCRTSVLDADLVREDFLLWGGFQGVSVGDTITLSSGTLVSSGPVAGIAPTGTSFNSFLVSTSDTRISTDGVMVPEPTAYALLGLAGTSLFFRRRRGLAC